MSAKPETKNDQLKDPVCDMTVSDGSEYTCLLADKQYYFCSEHCLQKFKEHPEQYLAGKSTQPLVTNGESGTYTCPMHPEVIQDHPGSCPKCGMSLEPATFSGEEKNEELIDMTRRFWVCTALALPVFFLAMIADMMPGCRFGFPCKRFNGLNVRWHHRSYSGAAGRFLFAAGNPS